MYKAAVRAVRMAPGCASIKFLLCKHENLSVIPITHVRLSMVV